jgi:hypothetical protein
MVDYPSLFAWERPIRGGLGPGGDGLLLRCGTRSVHIPFPLKNMPIPSETGPISACADWMADWSLLMDELPVTLSCFERQRI